MSDCNVTVIPRNLINLVFEFNKKKFLIFLFLHLKFELLKQKKKKKLKNYHTNNNNLGLSIWRTTGRLRSVCVKLGADSIMFGFPYDPYISHLGFKI